jgi:hypothetical protein
MHGQWRRKIVSLYKRSYLWFSIIFVNRAREIIPWEYWARIVPTTSLPFITQLEVQRTDL